MAVKREHTLAVTWGRWSGFYIAGKRKYLLRVCLGFVAVTYFRGEMTEALDVWLKSEGF